jgi:hypothetical protein
MIDRAAPRSGVVLIVSIDTEEDNWDRSRHNVTLENIETLPRVAAFCDRLRVRPTYFTTYHVATDPRAADVMREVGSGDRAEIGGHLHPWNTPPLSEPFVPRNSMLKNLPAGLQLAKIQTLTAALEEAFDFTPTAFRTGRYGLGRDTIAALLSCGYRTDSSVSPFINLAAVDDGPSFVGAPMVPYRLGPGQDVREPVPDGALLEIPLSYGFNRGPFSLWDPTRRLLEARPLRWFRLAGLAARTGLVKRLTLCPEVASVTDMLTLSRRLLEHGVPRLSPFAATAREVARLYDSIEAYLEGLSSMTAFTAATVSEAAAMLG